MDALIYLIGAITNVIIMLVIIQFVIGLLFAFNVINTGNQFIYQVYESIGALLKPILDPIRRFMPQTGAIDFSPIVLIILLNVITIMLSSI